MTDQQDLEPNQGPSVFWEWIWLLVAHVVYGLN